MQAGQSIQLIFPLRRASTAYAGMCLRIGRGIATDASALALGWRAPAAAAQPAREAFCRASLLGKGAYPAFA